MIKICHFCGNKSFNKRNVKYIYEQENKFLIVNDVPCVQCDFCGEQYFKATVLKTIEDEFNQLYTYGKKPKIEINVPIEQFIDLQHV
jgi:YgiT-type zinc finger domain-containing protein